MKQIALWVEEYVDYCRIEKGLADNSVLSYGRDLNHLVEFSNEQGWSNGPAEYLQVLEFLAHLQKKQLSTSSSQRMISTLRNFYRYLLQNNKMKVDPTAQLEAPKRFRKLPKMLSRNQM